MMKRFLFGIIAAVVSLNALAFEDKSNLYISAGFGQTDLNVEELEDYYGVELPKPDAAEFTLGYRIDNNWTAELGFTDFGEISGGYEDEWFAGGPYFYSTDPLTGVEYWEEIHETYGANAKLTASSIRLGTVLSTDASELLSLGLRLGFHMWNADLSAREYSEYRSDLTEGYGGPVVDSLVLSDWGYDDFTRGSEDGTDLYYGLVANLNLNQFTLSAAYTVYEMDDLEPSTTTIALGYNF